MGIPLFLFHSLLPFVCLLDTHLWFTKLSSVKYVSMLRMVKVIALRSQNKFSLNLEDPQEQFADRVLKGYELSKMFMV